MKKYIYPTVFAIGLLAAPIHFCAAADSETGFQKIFNGKDLAGWNGNPKLWSVKDSTIVGQTTAENPIKANTFLIWTNGEVADFELRASFKITANNDKEFANSGIQYRSKVLDAAGWVVGGYQADMEAGSRYTGILYDERGVAGGRGIMAERGQKILWDKDCQKQITGSLGDEEQLRAAIKKNDWNDYVIIAKGNHLQHFINGKQTVDVTDECAAKAVKSGVLALQLHAGQPMTVWFKNIRLKTFSGNASAAEDLKKLQGDWRIAGGEAGGVAVPGDDLPEVIVTVKDTSFKTVRGDSTDQGSFTIDPSKQPRQMDVRGETGRNAGKNVAAIYEVDENTLRVCYARAGGDRPKDFATTADDGDVLIIYKRKKP